MATELQVKNTPAVRFRGFDDEWEQVKLGDVVDFYSGLTYSPNDVSDNGVFVLRSSNVKNGEIIDADNVYVDKSVVNSKYVEPDDIIVVVRNGSRNLIGKHATVKDGLENTVIGAFMTGIKSDTPFFINALLDSQQFEREIYKNLGATINQITTGNFKKMKFKTPSLDEQQKIGELFQTLDHTIDLSNTQVENLKQQKKALLQRLFPQKGETEPTIRLRGFTDEWEEVKLGDVFSVYSEKGHTDLPFVTVGERETNERTASAQGYGNDVSDKARAKAKVLLSGQFLIDLSSYGRGIYMSRMDGVTSSAYNVLNLDNGADSYWVEYLISHDFVESLKRLTPPGARQGKMIEVDGLLKTKTFVPSLDEQQAIGELFQTLDEQIRLAEDKVSQYKELKQALLQRMFV